MIAVLRIERPLFGGDAAELVSADLARLLRVVLTSRGSVAADSADSLLQTTDRSLLGIGTLAAVFLLTRCMRSLQRALAAIAGVAPRSPRREWVRAAVLAVSVLVIGNVILAGFTLGPLFGHSRRVGRDHVGEIADTIWMWARWPLVGVIILGLAMVLLAQETPRGRRRRRSGLTGAGFTVIGWAVSTGLLPLYVSVAAPFSPALGSMGGGLILLTWLYLLMVSLLLGAEINAVRRAPSGTAVPSS
ncbi:membrane protein [Nakamurella flavida]|nr:membrane protein [Nakamurella flavida]